MKLRSLYLDQLSLSYLLFSQIAYSLLSGGEKEKDVDPIDAHYKKLKTEIEVLEQTT